MRGEKDQVFSAIQEAISTGAIGFLAAFRQDWTGESMYSFLLEAGWEGESVDAVAGTEEGLLRIAQYYAEHEGTQDEESFKAQCIQRKFNNLSILNRQIEIEVRSLTPATS
jgi:hypothetical protein